MYSSIAVPTGAATQTARHSLSFALLSTSIDAIALSQQQYLSGRLQLTL